MEPAGGDLAMRVTAMPTDLNPYGGVFGGCLMNRLALDPASLATRRTGLKALVISAKHSAFPGTMQSGDELNVYAEVVRSGRTSLNAAIRGFGRARASEKQARVANGTCTFVVLDAADRPGAVAASAQAA